MDREFTNNHVATQGAASVQQDMHATTPGTEPCWIVMETCKILSPAAVTVERAETPVCVSATLPGPASIWQAPPCCATGRCPCLQYALGYFIAIRFEFHLSHNASKLMP